MAGAEEIQVWVERSEVLDMKMSFGSSFIKEKKKKIYIYICSLYHYGISQNMYVFSGSLIFHSHPSAPELMFCMGLYPFFIA